jgi:type VI secretion system Hcp family effector
MRPDAFMTVARKNKFVDGESTDTELGSDGGLIEILSFSHTIAQVEKAPKTTDQTQLSEHAPLKVVKLLDVGSPKLHDYASQRVDDLLVTLSLLHRTGDSKAKPDAWKREKYLEIKLEHATISRIQLVLDPRVHNLNRRYVRDAEVLAMGPVEELEIAFGKITFWYGKASNKMTWTHTKYA